MESNEIIKNYEALLELAKELDSFFKVEKTVWSRVEVSEDRIDTYWEKREEIEIKLTSWMAVIRESINAIPPIYKKSVKESRFDPATGETYSVIVYDDLNFEALVDFFNNIKTAIEARDGVLYRIKEKQLIFDKLRSVKGDVLSFVKSLSLFAPEIMINIKQQVDLVFRLRDLGLLEVAELIEDIEQSESNIDKCVKARSALERTVQYFLQQKSITPRKRFMADLEKAIEEGMAPKERSKTIAEHYSFLSKIIHKEIDANTRNTQFAVYGTLEILQDILPK